MVFAYELVINFLYFKKIPLWIRQFTKRKLFSELASPLCEGGGKKEKLHSLPRILEEETGLQCKKIKSANDKSLDSALYQWFVRACSEGVPISGPILKAQAKKFDHLINQNESKFKTSNGWQDRFKKRHSISQVLGSGEIHSADKEAADSYPIELKKLLEEGCYTANQVYNCDETGLCFKILPDRTLATRTDITLLFCINKSGSHKVRPLRFGKASSPRCFHHANMKALPFEYTNSKNAWMNIFKQNYRREMIKRMVADNSSVDTSLASLNLKVVCHLSGKAWNAISTCCIERCWIKDLGLAFPSSTHDDGNDDEPEFTRFIEDNVCLAKEALRGYEHSHHDILNWFSADDICPVYEHILDDEIIANVSGKNEAAPPEPETSGANDADDNDGTSTPPPKVSEAVKHLEASLRWLETQDTDRVKILQLRSILDFARSQQSTANKQTTLESFFKK
uniref:HTH CENPB-type domain-containing protein n=1 Tax=Gopherus agassizii TaxID=38772 RepID=A0A452ILK5_9SAUR